MWGHRGVGEGSVPTSLGTRVRSRVYSSLAKSSHTVFIPYFSHNPGERKRRGWSSRSSKTLRSGPSFPETPNRNDWENLRVLIQGILTPKRSDPEWRTSRRPEGWSLSIRCRPFSETRDDLSLPSTDSLSQVHRRRRMTENCTRFRTGRPLVSW